MAVTKFQPEVWSSGILTVLDKALSYGSPVCVNRDYEGDVVNYGDTVHIVDVADPTISDYVKDNDLTIGALTDAEQNLSIDQAQSFSFQIDDIDSRQVQNNGELMMKAAARAGFGLADKADQYIAKKMSLAAGNSLGVVDATTATNVYDALIVPAAVKLDEANVPNEGRWIVLPPAAYGKLLLDSRFVKVNESGSQSLRNGVVGEAAGFTVLKSNNAAQANRTGLGATTASGTKNLTAAAAGTFTQGDVGMLITGTGIGASSNKIASVGADGTTAVTTVNQTASAAITDIALSGGGQLAIAGSPIATAYVEQINKVESARMEKRFADLLKGLHLYGAKVVRPSGLVVSSVKVA